MSGNVGNYIKYLRTSRNMTQEELGSIIGVKKAAVQKWESGMVQNLKRDTIKKLADYFEVTNEYMQNCLDFYFNKYGNTFFEEV